MTDLRTPDASLPPFELDPTRRRKMLITIEVSADFERRLDNQWEVEREIHADRWAWSWADEGRRISGPEVEFDEQTKQELTERLDDISRKQIWKPW